MSPVGKIVGLPAGSLLFFILLCIPGPAPAQDQFLTPSGDTVGVPPPPRAAPHTQRRAPDPGTGNIFFLPAAGTLSRGQFAVGVARPVGVGVYYGINNCFTMGVGGSPTVSVQLEGKWSLFKGLKHTFSLWGFFHYPFVIKVYQTDDGEDFEDGGLMLAGGFLYAYASSRVEVKLGILYYDFLMYDKYKTCKGDDCHREMNWYHKWLLTSPYAELGVKLQRWLKIFALVSTFQIRSITIRKSVSEGGVDVRKDKDFFWEDFFIAAGISFFRKRFAMDVGFVFPIIPSMYGKEEYPYAFPMAGISWVF